MSKSNNLTGHPIFSQLFQLIPHSLLKKAIKQYNSDRYYKKFDTQHHLVTMMYAAFQHCTSLREVVTGIKACHGNLQTLGITNFPTRSTLSEANQNRSYKVFEKIFYDLIGRYRGFLSDSRGTDAYFKKLLIIDSTTITLFKEILKNAGRKGMNGKRKGGIKVHTAMWSHEDIPYLIRFSPGASSDIDFMKFINPPIGSIIVMDKGYNNYHHFNRWTTNGVLWVTRARTNTKWVVRESLDVCEDDKKAGVISDELVTIGTGKNKSTELVDCRMVVYQDKELNKTFEFITSDVESAALTIAAIYKQRWQIELLFKRIKQNMPLNYFLGDNENAIKIQIYCALISDLLLKLCQKKVTRKWGYSNLASLVRLHLLSYTHLVKFLDDPDKYPISNQKPPTPPPEAEQLELEYSS